MIEAYLQQIDALLSTSPVVRDVEIVRRSIRDTELEKVLNYRYRVVLADGGLIEITERILAIQGTLEVTKYRHHWQDGSGRLIK
jgi:precorrin isomerase